MLSPSAQPSTSPSSRVSTAAFSRQSSAHPTPKSPSTYRPGAGVASSQRRCSAAIRKALTRVSAFALVALIHLPPAWSARLPAAVPEEVRQAVARDGSAPVIVELATRVGVETTMRPAARRQQRGLIARAQSALLGELSGSDPEILQRYRSIPFLALRVDAHALAALARSPRVRSVRADSTLRLGGELNTRGLVEADAMHALGFTGRGAAIAVIDSGVDRQHPDFTGRVSEEACFSQLANCPNRATRMFGPGAGVPCTIAGCDHGTAVAGIAVGAGGVAPEATVISLNVFSLVTSSQCSTGSTCPIAYTSDLIAGLEHVYDLRDRYRIAAVNLSSEGGHFTSRSACDAERPELAAVVANLRGAGIPVIAISGNTGRTNGLPFPACISGVVSVGATTLDGEIANFSGTASFLDLLAPGVSVQTLGPGGGSSEMTGTSASAPHVAGALALLAESNPEVNLDQTLAAIREGGQPLFDGRNGLTFPSLKIDAARALLTGPLEPCVADDATLCLLEGRFQLRATWQNQHSGDSGHAGAVPRSDLTGLFHFGNLSNLELVVKVVPFDDTIKVFYAQLTDFPFELTVTDTQSGRQRVYRNTPGNCGAVDDQGFPLAAASGGQEAGKAAHWLATAPGAVGSCVPSPTQLCLLSGRLAVDVRWRNQFNGDSGSAATEPLSDFTGLFTYADPRNIELLVKALDFGENILFLYGALSNLEYEIKVTDTTNGTVKSYLNPPGRYCGGLDPEAF